MARRRKDELEEPIVDLGEVSGQATDFYERNQRIILGVFAGIALVVVAYFAYSNFYQSPREIEAGAQISKAQFAMQQDSFEKALNDPGGGYDGFIGISEKYGGTKAGNLSKFYAAQSFLQLGNFDIAIRYLNDYSAKESLTKSLKQGMLGDAYSELQKFDKAISHYKKAASASGDDATAPYYLKKAGMLLEKQGKAKDALNIYKKIQKEYYETEIGKNIDKYISRVEK